MFDKKLSSESRLIPIKSNSEFSISQLKICLTKSMKFAVQKLVLLLRLQPNNKISNKTVNSIYIIRY